MSKVVRTKKAQRAFLLEILEKEIPVELLSKIPNRWWKIGDILLLTIPKQLADYHTIIGEAMLKLEENKIRTVLGKMGPTKGITRVPEFIYLAGDPNTETIHKELGCLFKLDAAKLTFSPGNHGERKRMIDIVHSDELIVDIFGCVGNLSLPLAIHNSPKQLVIAEINPIAFQYLTENISLNNVTEIVKPLLGDNRTILIEYEGLADRVIAGYLHSDTEQIRQGIRLCKENGIFHYHEGAPIKVQDQPFARVKKVAKQEDRKVELLKRQIVKKYAPGVEHIVLDLKII
ncbi:MAG: class I SAM-dependent methyltransferase family protein [Asgard group archaeon]|nr:class I SAM-dependent methyltransferase family protein [Asgard group archaeon]